MIERLELIATKPVNQILKDAITKGIQEAVLRLNTDIQLGILNEDSTGKNLYETGGEYTQYTQDVKGVNGQDVDLKDTGAYWRSFRVIILENGDIAIDSNPIKGDDDLEARYGDNLEGLNDEHTEFIKKVIREEIVKQLLG